MSLARNPLHRLQTAREALLEAIRPGVTGTRGQEVVSDFEKNRGFGLFFLCEIAKRSFGSFILASEDTLLFQDGIKQYLHPIRPIQGTLLAIELHEDYLEEFYSLQNELIQQMPMD